MENEVKEEKKSFKVKANVRFLFAPTGRIYDPGDIFEVGEADKDYLTGNKLVALAPKDAEITETAQDKQEKIAAGLDTEDKKIEALSVINEIQTKEAEKPAKVKTTKTKK